MSSYETEPLSRRRFLFAAGALGAGALTLPRVSRFAAPSTEYLPLRGAGPVQQIRQAAASDPVGIQHLRGNITVLTGSGGNVAVLPGEDGTLLVDSGIVGPKIAAAVTSFTPVPVRHLINSHWHFDHTDANAWHRRNGAAILAHENTRKRLLVDTRVEDWNFTFPQSPAEAIPGTVFSDQRTVHLNGTRIDLKKFAPAHTDADISIHFTDADVLHVADTWWNGMYPFIDYSTLGSIDGMISALGVTRAAASATTVIIPGHGDVGDRVALGKYQDMLMAIRDRVASLKKKGLSVAEVVAAKPTAPFDAEYG
ncbi:MAG: MBL fold metallo-hydrolase, partial [bacterium]